MKEFIAVIAVVILGVVVGSIILGFGGDASEMQRTADTDVGDFKELAENAYSPSVDQ